MQETRRHDSCRSGCVLWMCRKTAHAVRKVSATRGSSAAVAASPREQLLPLLMHFCRGTWHARLHGSGRARRSGRQMKRDALDAAPEPPFLAQPTKRWAVRSCRMLQNGCGTWLSAMLGNAPLSVGQCCEARSPSHSSDRGYSRCPRGCARRSRAWQRQKRAASAAKESAGASGVGVSGVTVSASAQV